MALRAFRRPRSKADMFCHIRFELLVALALVVAWERHGFDLVGSRGLLARMIAATQTSVGARWGMLEQAKGTYDDARCAELLGVLGNVIERVPYMRLRNTKRHISTSASTEFKSCGFRKQP